MNKNKKKPAIISIVLILLGVGYLAFSNFGKNLVYFFTPSEVVAFTPSHYGKKVRVAGMVVRESVKMIPNTLEMTFRLSDGKATIPIHYKGVPPDLFKEGQGAVVEGYWNSDLHFYSKMIMAKHSEDYMPPEMKQAGVSLPRKDLLKTLQVE
ncbi:MAG: cytochrome c maturation protein CcmE [Nitrospirae bacterium]|nr:cytochrome c maturation protein CcmE [Candidatus Troglogloeales bacterium]